MGRPANEVCHPRLTLDIHEDRSHGYYSIQMDQGDKQYFNGYSANNSVHEVLFASQGLETGNHSVRLMNESEYMSAQDLDGSRICKSPFDAAMSHRLHADYCRPGSGLYRV